MHASGIDGLEPPIAVGGIGGSGTRVVADVLTRLGIYMGSDFNEARDNLWFTLLFKRTDILSASDEQFRRRVDIFVNAMVRGRSPCDADRALIEQLASSDRPQHRSTWLRQRVESLLAAASPEERHTGPWGWKEPNTHIVVDRLAATLPDMKYIHVARNGLDMAYSTNQNQLKLWGPALFGMSGVEVNPFQSLKYWCASHRRLLRIGQTLGARFLFLNFDHFCANPRKEARRLLDFLEIRSSEATLDSLSALILAPKTIGRYRGYPQGEFDPEDVAYVAQLGFQTTF